MSPSQLNCTTFRHRDYSGRLRRPHEPEQTARPLVRVVPKPEVGPPESEHPFREFRLSNDTPQGAASDRIVKRNWNGNSSCLEMFLHDSIGCPVGGRGRIRVVREFDKPPSPKEPGVYPTGTST